MSERPSIPVAVAVALTLAVSSTAAGPEAQRVLEVQGSYEPSGPPHPERRPVGDLCVVDLEQSYRVDGSLSGTMTVDYRIFVAGPCGSPPGTFDEHWIAIGRYDLECPGGTGPATGDLVDVAEVSAGGHVAGKITLAGDLRGSLRIDGNFREGSIHYAGSIAPPAKD